VVRCCVVPAFEDHVEGSDPASTLLTLYPVAVREVYGFLVARCGSHELAEDLTSETFMAAVTAVREGTLTTVSTGWMIVVARRRLIDHWRRREREHRVLQVVAGTRERLDDPWEETLDMALSRTVLATLPPEYQASLTLRYLDGLPVADVAEFLERGLHSTEGLLQRARAAFRQAYEEGGLHAS
jgi:RNA polymerase sigma-70 factor, ECF subfamily